MPPAAARRHLATWRPMRIRLWLGFALGVVAFAAASANGAPIVAIFTVAGTDKGGFGGDGRPGTGAAHLPPKLLSGKRRLTKDHYVVGVTAKSGTASAAASAELVVK
jgi:hypothetical protein